MQQVEHKHTHISTHTHTHAHPTQHSPESVDPSTGSCRTISSSEMKPSPLESSFWKASCTQ